MTGESKKKKELDQLKNSEKKYQSYIDRRNSLNDLAKVLRDERDMINDKHKETKETMKKSKTERDELVKKMRNHRDIRNKLQEQAKKLIEARRMKKGEVFRNLPLRLEELKADVQMLEYRQETVPMSSAEENDLIDKIREKKIEYDSTIKKVQAQKDIEIDISDKDKAIDELFKKADEEHKKVQQFYDDSQKKHEEYIKLANELAVSISEANKKHEQYIQVRNEAQSNHEKAIEMRSKIVAVKDERRKKWKEANTAIKEQNIKARKATMNKEKLNEHADESLNLLKKGQKISL